jgi:DNA repair protein RecN (Recombination protein N)
VAERRGRVAALVARFPSPSGLDEVELRFAGTPGQPLLPLQAVASGGELARVCLALKRALAEVDDTPLLVFDEVDQNVGGRLGAAIGRTLVAISAARQVIAVTHLPSVAAYATHHFTVAKAITRTTDGASGRTTVRALTTSAEREHEIALMIRGDPVSDTALEQARELLRIAEAPPPQPRIPAPPRRATRAARARRASRAPR